MLCTCVVYRTPGDPLIVSGSGGHGKDQHPVSMWSPTQAQVQNVGFHDSPVKSVAFLEQSKLVVSSGLYDRVLKFWDSRSPNPTNAIQLRGKIRDLDVCNNRLVAATAGRQLVVYDVSGAEAREVERMESRLNFDTRSISILPDATGLAVGSIGGRVAIQYLPHTHQVQPYDFAAHIHTHTPSRDAYAVNAISFHKQYGTFATAGSDGVVSFWKNEAGLKKNQRRLKTFPPIHRPIPCATFNEQGNLFAYASSYDWSKGSAYAQDGNDIYVHTVSERDVRPQNFQG